MAAFDIQSYGGSYLKVDRIESSSAGTESYLNCLSHIYRVVGGNSVWSTTFYLPQIATSIGGNTLHFVQWDGVGALTFARGTGSTDLINGGASAAYADGSGSRIFIVAAVGPDRWSVVPIHAGGSLVDVTGQPPNVSVTTLGVVDAGHHTANSLFFACSANHTPPTLGADSVGLGDVTGTLAANEIVLGSGAAVNQAGITLPALAGVAHVAADSTHSLRVSIGGVTYYVMLTTVAP